LMAQLAEAGIETRTFFEPMHLQPALRRYGVDGSGAYPVSTTLGERGFYLPSGSNLGPGEIDFVVEHLQKCLC